MKLVMHSAIAEHFRPNMVSALQRCFDHAAEELKILDAPDRVYLRVVIDDPSTRGSTNRNHDPAKKRPSWVPIIVNLNLMQQSFLEMLDAFSHEMVHVRQEIHNEIVADPENDLVFFRGEKVIEPENSLEGLQVPWEKEAYDLQPTIFRGFLETLEKEELTDLVMIGKLDDVARERSLGLPIDDKKKVDGFPVIKKHHHVQIVGGGVMIDGKVAKVFGTGKDGLRHDIPQEVLTAIEHIIGGTILKKALSKKKHAEE